MSLNIKNPRTHELVRELAKRTGQSQTSAVEEAVARRLAELGVDARTLAARDRLASARAVISAFRADLDPAEAQRLRAEQDDIYDEAGLPR